MMPIHDGSHDRTDERVEAIENSVSSGVGPPTSSPKVERRSFHLSFSEWVQLLLLIVTTLYLIVTFGIFRAARDANEATKQVVAATQRAYLEFGQILPADGNVKNYRNLALILENTGKVPGSNVTGHCGWTIVSLQRGQDLSVDLNKLPITHRGDLSIENVAAGQMCSARVDLKAITPEIAQAIDTKQAQLMVLTQLAYDDPFAKGYHSFGCFVFEPGSGWMGCNFGGEKRELGRSFKLPTRD